MNFIEYEENIYVGYRYYETADDTGGTFTVNGRTGQLDGLGHCVHVAHR